MPGLIVNWKTYGEPLAVEQHVTRIGEMNTDQLWGNHYEPRNPHWSIDTIDLARAERRLCPNGR